MELNSLFSKIAAALSISNLDGLDIESFSPEVKHEFVSLNKDSLYDLYEKIDKKEKVPLVESSPTSSKKKRNSFEDMTKLVTSMFRSKEQGDSSDTVEEIHREQEKKLIIAHKVLETQITQLEILKGFYLAETEEKDKQTLIELAETKRRECKESIKVIIASSIFATESVRHAQEERIGKKKNQIEELMKVFEQEENIQ